MTNDLDRLQRRTNWLYRAIMTLAIVGAVLNFVLLGLGLAGF
jgi:hypothetical protein